MLSKELATICLDIPMEYDWASMTLDAPQAETLRGTLEDLEFRTLLGAFWVMPRPLPLRQGPPPRPLLLRTPAQLDLFGRR